jgi:hypothetical protein
MQSIKPLKAQRTGLTEGSLIFNNWLKSAYPPLFREDTEDEFINWLYSTGGWYDKDIPGSYFDIDTSKVKKSKVFQRFLSEFESSLAAEIIHLMLHSSWHLNGLEHKYEYARRFSTVDYCYWQDLDWLSGVIENPFVVNSFAPLIEEKYGIPGYKTPYTFFNDGPHKNSFETLDFVWEQLPKEDYTYLVSFGSYGCLLVDRLNKAGCPAMTIGSGLHSLYPVEVTQEYRPKDYMKIEEGRYFL